MNAALVATPPLNTPANAGTATRPVGLVVVGANFGALIAQNLSAGGPVRVSGICDLNTAAAATLANRLGVPVYDGLDAVLADPTVEAVGVFTGPAGRGRLLERILDAGKHVMTTKPFELVPAEAERAFAAAKRNGRALHLNSPAPVPPTDLRHIRRWLAEADLGRPVSLHARTWADYAEQADGSWRDDPLRCPAGPLFRLGVYFFSDFAGIPGRPVEVHVQHSRLRTGRPTPDNAQISIAYEGGALANIFASFCISDGQAYRDEVVLACERGTIRRWMVRTGNTDMSQDHAVAELQRPGKAPERIVTTPGDFAGWYGWEAFHAAVRGLPGAVMHDAESTINGVRLLDALGRAANSGQVEKV